MKFFRLVRTLSYMKSIQVIYQLKHRVYRPKYKEIVAPNSVTLKVEKGLASANIFKDNSFSFLNRTISFGKIDWNYMENGKLWCYNLNYFEFLRQDKLKKQHGLELILDYVLCIWKLKDGLEAYPISLRGINWIRFLSLHQIQNAQINKSLYSQYFLLSRKLEYHLLGNHLLENGFSMLWGALYFSEPKFYLIAREILISELKEQVLADGAHFELSPMYHCIILERTLDAYALVKNNKGLADELLPLLKDSSEMMLSWLEQMCVGNTFPLLNDSSEGIAAEPKKLKAYAKRLGLASMNLGLGESGYRRLDSESLCLIADLGEVGSSYIPGHAHADMLNFVMYHYDHPIIVDSGTSTYEWGDIRNYERGTSSHNTVQVDNEEQSELWGSHRVGRRAKVKILKDKANEITALVEGFTKNRKKHLRSFLFEGHLIQITDEVENGKKAIARLHFHPDVKIIQRDNDWLINDLSLTFSGAKCIRLVTYEYGVGFNKRIPAKCLEIMFREKLETYFSE